MEKTKILIVEDEYIIAMEIASQLKSLGYEVVSTAKTGIEAIERADVEKPNLITMDIQLKGEMDGIEAAKHIRAKSDIPIVFLSAYAEEEKIKRAKLTLPYGYLIKPVQNRDLKVTIEMALYAFEIKKERDKAQEALKKANEDLEDRVAERTEKLQHEIGERRQIEEGLLIARKEAESANQSKTEFLANISHELRNPMHQILSYSKYGIEKIDKPREKLRHYFNQIRKSAKRLMMLLNDLLDLSKMESGRMDYKMEINNVFQIVNETVSELKSAIEEKNLSFKLNDPSISTNVTCDFYKVGQVVRNLLSNAIKFTPEEKSIKIEFKRNESKNENNKMLSLELSVIDQGVGIPESELTSVFDKFTQSSKTKTGAGGTGLGLSICHEIVKAHGGKIWAENNPEGGATFSFVLPYQQEVD